MLGKYKSSKKKSRKRKSRNHRRGLVFVGGGLGDDFRRIIDDAIKSNIEHYPEWRKDVKTVKAIVTTFNTRDIYAKMGFLSQVYEYIIQNEAQFKTSPILYSIYNIILVGTYGWRHHDIQFRGIDKEGVEEVVLNIQTHLYDLISTHIKEVALHKFTPETKQFMFYCKMLIEVRNSLESALIENTRVKIEGPKFMEYYR